MQLFAYAFNFAVEKFWKSLKLAFFNINKNWYKYYTELSFLAHSNGLMLEFIFEKLKYADILSGSFLDNWILNCSRKQKTYLSTWIKLWFQKEFKSFTLNEILLK